MSTQIPGSTIERPDALLISHTVVAAFPSIESARTAADALAGVAIPADRIALAPAEEGVPGQWAAPYGYEERNAVSSTVASGAVLGALIGGVGALVLAGLLGAFFNVDLSGFVLLFVMAFGAVGVGALGGFMNGSPLDRSTAGAPAQAWPRVSVECIGDDEAADAIRVLRERGPVELHQDEEQLI
jgi:hypothetical protein